MRVLELISSLDVGGAEIALANRLRFAPEHIRTAVAHGPPVGPIEVELPASVKRFPVQSWRRDLDRATKQFRPDLVIVHSPSMMVRLWLWRKARGTPPILFISHGELISESRLVALVIMPFFKIAIRSAFGGIAVSTSASKLIPEGIPSRVIMLGASVSDAKQSDVAEIDAGDIRLLALSRLTKGKNISLAIKALARAREDPGSPSICLDIVGDGPDRRRLERLAKKLNLQHVISFHGLAEDPNQFLRRADSIIITSRSEGGPLTAFEALLSGSNVVSTNVGVVADLQQIFPERVFISGSKSALDFSSALRMVYRKGPITTNDRLINKEESKIFDAEVCTDSFYQFVTELANRHCE